LDLSDPDYETALAVMHQRYSTNTFPNWFLAQPFRMVAQNGEINTLWGNRNWMRAREPELASRRWGKRIERLKPVIWEAGSDSASLDNAMELIALSGRDLLQSVMMLIPEAFENSNDCDPRIRAFYEYSAGLMEPWDGPAAIAFSDGRFVGAALDRNGLRPARYIITNDNRVIMASEAGAAPVEPAAIVKKGRLGPGQMLAVDVERGVVLQDWEIKLEQARRKPYGNWLRRNQISARHFEVHCELPTDSAELYASMRRFGYTLEDVTRVLEPMLSSAKEPVGSMGDDTPLAVLSTKPRLLYSYFKQRFAQVTNPAIDPIRERVVMSLEVRLGRRGNLLDESPSHARLVKLPGPVLTDSALDWIRELREPKFGSETLIAGFKRDGEEAALEAAVEELSEQAVATVQSGASILILSDRNLDASEAPIPMLLAISAVHHKLIRAGLRTRVSLIAETGEAREDHHFACLIGYGASAVNPYLAYQVVAHQVARRGMSVPGALRNYKTAVENGLLKIMAKMGISTLASYCGAQIFEAVGLSSSLIDRYFTGTPCRIGGVGVEAIAQDACRFAEQGAVDGLAMVRTKNGNGADMEWPSVLEDAGFFRYRSGGEYHSFNPDVFRALHRVARHQRQEGYDSYRTNVNTRPPVSIRDLLDFLPGTPIPKEEVEPVENILRRFSTSGMSHGALSREAHETLAIAMNRIGARSNSGEGGEATSRYPRRQLFGPDSSGAQMLRAGDSANSRIKQVASARFGVTPEYLMSASELEIKISQGSKPGEGGQLPGDKVSAEIAAIRHSVPGVTLISPPPHHDIYSIEDLAQLIYDLKQINPTARIAVKLVAEAGVGTVAAGVAKAFADVVHISGHDGGTGASPLGSIKNAGTSWELGLAESHQVLVMNGLRSRVKVRTDGGLKTGRDVVIAAMLGADEFGFATTALVALGCVMARQCHLNTCPVG
ncbi:MAG: glutamate synthase large subunit, partial [Blastocatellia bacterium]